MPQESVAEDLAGVPRHVQGCRDETRRVRRRQVGQGGCVAEGTDTPTPPRDTDFALWQANDAKKWWGAHPELKAQGVVSVVVVVVVVVVVLVVVVVVVVMVVVVVVQGVVVGGGGRRGLV